MATLTKSTGGDRAEIVLERGADGKPTVTGLAKIGPDGRTLRAVQSRVRLDPNKKETFDLTTWARDPQGGRPIPIRTTSVTAAGYDRLNTYTGIKLVYAPYCIDEHGARVGNPYSPCDARGNVRLVMVRRIGIGRNAVGELVFSERQIAFDLEAYLAQDVYSKWTGKKSDAACKEWGTLVSYEEAQTVALEKGKKAINIPGIGVLIVSLSHREVVNCIGEHINRVKFAERIATTIADRNILKHFYGAAILGADMSVTVTAWVSSDAEINAMHRAIINAEPLPQDPHPQSAVVDPIDYEEAVESFTDEQGHAFSGEGEISPPPEIALPSPTPKEPPKKLHDRIREIGKKLGGKSYAGILASHGTSGLAVLELNDEAKLREIIVDLEKIAGEKK